MTGCNDMLYHIIARDENLMSIFEFEMDKIFVENIEILKHSKNSIRFTDKKNEYTFSLSKNTLFERFNTSSPIGNINIEIAENPFDLLKKINFEISKSKTYEKENIILPLYAYKTKNKSVPEKSGLNQWNAGGRQRDDDEIYIPVPAFIYKYYPNFFDVNLEEIKLSSKFSPPFNLLLPNGEKLEAKICQQNGKAIMSNPNKALGAWLLRDVLKLKKGRLITRKMLDKLGIDSIRLTKIDNKNYAIDFAEVGSFEYFLSQTMHRSESKTDPKVAEFRNFMYAD
jgi:hypothetical protein